MNIKLDYYSVLLDEDFIREIKRDLKNNSIELMVNDKSDIPQMGLDEIISSSLVYFTPEIISSFASGILTNAAYDALKNSIILILCKVKGKKYNKVSAGGKVEEKDASIGINFKKDGDSFYLKLPNDLPSELQSKCIDKAFELMATPEKSSDMNFSFDSKTIIGSFNSQTQEWEVVDIHEIIKKMNQNQ